MRDIFSGNTGRIIGVRHLQIIFMFTNVTIAYFTRISTSVAVVAMTNRNTTNPDFEEFQWTLQEQSLILSSFYWGYVVTQLPSGWIAQLYGAKFIFFFSTLCASILGMLVPVLVHNFGWQAYCAVRILQGLAQGFIFPTMHSFVAKWSPFKERNILGTISHSGIEVGTILAFTASGYIAGSSMGWPGIYYISGGLGVIWSILWLLFGASFPHQCKYISTEEQNYIEASLQINEETQKEKLPVPWKAIWLSGPFITLLMTRNAHAWGFSTLMNEIPKYMNGILGMNIQENALFSGVPYMSMLIACYTSMFLSNFLMKKNVPLLIIRKVFNTIAFWGPGFTLIGLSFVSSENAVLAVILFAVTVGSNGFHTIGSVLNHIDLAPNHAGILMGISNTSGNIVVLFTPLVFSAIVSDQTNIMQWRIVFYIAAGIFIAGNLIFLLFGQVAAQPWNERQSKTSDIEKQKESKE